VSLICVFSSMRTFVPLLLWVCLVAFVDADHGQRRIDKDKDDSTIFFQQDPQMGLIEIKSKDGNSNSLGVGERIHLKDYSLGVTDEGLFTINLQQHEMISVNEKGKVTMNADLYVKNLNVNDDIVVGGISQWRLVRSDIFTDKTISTTWNFETYLDCPAFSMITTTKKTPITYTYLNLPSHTQVQLQATVHFVDDWQGETAYLKIDDEYVWTKSHGQEVIGHTVNVCGSPLFGETSFTVPIDVAVWNKNKQLKLEFGTTLEEGVTAYLGLSSISLYIRESLLLSSGGDKDPNKQIDPSYPSPFADSSDNLVVSSSSGPAHKK